jgi:hypothetical protein
MIYGLSEHVNKIGVSTYTGGLLRRGFVPDTAEAPNKVCFSAWYIITRVKSNSPSLMMKIILAGGGDLKNNENAC